MTIQSGRDITANEIERSVREFHSLHGDSA